MMDRRVRVGVLAIAAGGGASAFLLGACSAILGSRDLTLGSDDAAALGDGAPSNQDDGASNIPSADGGDSGDAATSNGQDGGDAATTCAGADLQTDGHHCGRCGHDCLGGGCAAGVCQAFVLVPNQAGAQGIAVDSSGIYWGALTAGQVVKASTDGTGVTVLSNEPGAEPLAVAVDATNVYWTLINTEQDATPGRVNRCAKSGCPGGVTHLTGAIREAFGLAVDSDNVYWTELDNGAVGRANKNDGGGLGYLVTQQGFAPSAVINGPTLYFAASYEVGAIASNASVVAAQNLPAATPFRTIYPSPGNASFNPYGIAVDDTNIYWANNSATAGAILYAPKTSTGQAPPSTLASHEVSPVQIAIDDTNVYWVARGPNSTPNSGDPTYLSGTLAMCPKSGCPNSAPIILAHDLHNPRWVAVDAAAIYFTIHGNPVGVSNPAEGSIMKIAK